MTPTNLIEREAADAESLGALYRQIQSEQYACSEIVCVFPHDGNCCCFNTALARHTAQRLSDLTKPTPAAIAFALPLTNEPDDEDWRIGDEACEILACVNTDGELAAAQLSRDYKNVAAALRAPATINKDAPDE